MKTILLLFSVLTLLSCGKESSSSVISDPNPPADSSNVIVTNGYGSGRYKTGDTVHIFSVAYSSIQLFDTWTSTDAALLDGKEEWHTWFIMPSRNLSFTGNVKSITTVTLNYEQIRGRDRMKPVYSYFPAGHKGFVLLLHGTSGNAANFTNSYEYQQLIKDMVNDNFGVIITEAEESTTGVDANGDEKISWATVPFDSTTNVDFANIKIITDTFYNRGTTNRNKFRYSVGMSNGGNFSAWLSNLYKYKAAVSYCAPAGLSILTTNTPLQFCMARFDNNENVGPTGNANALQNSEILISRGICSKYLVNEHSPLYAERFARKGDITISKSAGIFNELKANHFLNSRNYFIGFQDDLTAAWQLNPSSFPQFSALTVLQRLTVLEQISLAVADHHMYSDYNRATLRFLNTQCN